MAVRHADPDKRSVNVYFTELVARVQVMFETLSASLGWATLLNNLHRARWTYCTKGAIEESASIVDTPFKLVAVELIFPITPVSGKENI